MKEQLSDEDQIRIKRSLLEGFGILRGLVEGFNQGFYSTNQTKVTEECLGEETARGVVFLVNGFVNPDFDSIVEALIGFYRIYILTSDNCNI